MIHYAKFLKLIAAMTIVTAMPADLSAKENKNVQEQGQKNDYHFTIKNEPRVRFVKNGPGVVVPYGSKTVYTLGNRVLSSSGDSIIDVEFTPFSYVVVTNGKKYNSAKVMNYIVYNEELHNFKHKNIGSPTATTFTPDTRKLLLATDKGVLIIGSQDYLVTDTIEVPFTVKDMKISENAYYLLARDDNQVAVYNLEEKKLRKKWKFDEKVTDARFSDDNTELAILTNDGVMSIYDTRSFLLKKNVEGLGEGLAFSFHPEGKYIAVLTSPGVISVINMFDDTDREMVENPEGASTLVEFLRDFDRKDLLAFNAPWAVNVKVLTSLTPNYNKLVADGADELMSEWLKMMPGETMDEYRNRVTDEARARQRQLFEDEIASGLAGDLVSMATITLGKYDRANHMLALAFDNMPTIYISVPESSVTAFKNPEDLVISDVKYGILPNDKFELVYAKIYNKANGETYIYNNVERVPLNFMENEESLISIDILEQQQMEELRLQELKRKIVEEAKQSNVITDHTNITVDSRLESTYDANGKQILNYKVKFSYEVEPDFSVHEDFGPGKYHVDESGAARSMLTLVNQAINGDFSQYVADGKKLIVNISGSADATPIRSALKYDGVYGDFTNEPVRQNGELNVISLSKNDPISLNEQLAFLRGYGVKDYLEREIPSLQQMKKEYNYNINVAEGKGSEFRRITVEFTFVDAF